MSWQLQAAKQRFSEVLRAAEADGPQTITRHGESIAVIMDMASYRRLTGPRRSFAEHVMRFPKLESATDVFDEIEAERSDDLGREADLGLDQ